MSSAIKYFSHQVPSTAQYHQADVTALLRLLRPKFLAGGDFNTNHVHWGALLSTPAKLTSDNNYGHLSTGSSQTDQTNDIIAQHCNSCKRMVWQATRACAGLCRITRRILLKFTRQ